MLRTAAAILAPAFVLAVLTTQLLPNRSAFADVTPETPTLLETFDAEFVRITPGEKEFPAAFVMGAEKGAASEQPAHKVTFVHSFSIAKYEVPQNLYEAVMGKNPSKWKGARNSVEMFSFDEAAVSFAT